MELRSEQSDKSSGVLIDPAGKVKLWKFANLCNHKRGSYFGKAERKALPNDARASLSVEIVRFWTSQALIQRRISDFEFQNDPPNGRPKVLIMKWIRQHLVGPNWFSRSNLPNWRRFDIVGSTMCTKIIRPSDELVGDDQIQNGISWSHFKILELRVTWIN